jgi:hypothetical protein
LILRRVIGGWSKLHNEELHNLYISPNIFRVTKLRRMKWAGQGEVRNVYKIVVGNPEQKRPPRKSKYRWVSNITMEPKEIGCEDMDWIHLPYDRVQWCALVNMIMKLGVP